MPGHDGQQVQKHDSEYRRDSRALSPSGYNHCMSDDSELLRSRVIYIKNYVGSSLFCDSHLHRSDGETAQILHEVQWRVEVSGEPVEKC